MNKSGFYIVSSVLFSIVFANIAFANEFMAKVVIIAEILNIISFFVILASLISIFFGIIKYFNAKDDKDKKQKAKNIIFSALILLFLSFWLYLAINYSTPGPYGGGLITD